VGGVAPLLLVTDLLDEVRRTSAREAEAAVSAQVLDYVVERDRRLLEVLSEIPHPGLTTRVEAFLDLDRMKLADLADHGVELQLSPGARLGLEALHEGELSEAVSQRDALVSRHADLEVDLESVERRLAAIPAPESIAPLIADVVRREREAADAEAALDASMETYSQIERDLAAERARYQSTLDAHVRQSLATEDAERILRHSARARQTLASFKREVVSHHVHRLEKLILGGLNELLRKSDLIVDVSIDPDTFEIQLKDSSWQTLSPDQLSAGERQLLAVSLLWALAKASDQAAPTVIDTPLGRLDSRHRDRLVQRYFPYAGDQVILLSTDEEVDEALYEKLKPHLSRSFTITQTAGSDSEVSPGYQFVVGKSVSEAA
jgi:DNA sulfur modification protein DndD